MREILFRGKRTDNDKWVEGFYLTSPEFDNIGISVVTAIDPRHPHYVFKNTVGQYTGLNDKNGTKIFEGDIIKFGINQRLMYVHWNEETLTWELTDIGVPACEVNHLSNTFDLGEIQVESAYGEMFSEVVGNIHDNSELLNN